MSRFFRLSFALVLATVSFAACKSSPTDLGMDNLYLCGNADCSPLQPTPIDE